MQPPAAVQEWAQTELEEDAYSHVQERRPVEAITQGRAQKKWSERLSSCQSWEKGGEMHHEVISSVRPDSHRFHANSEAGMLVRRMLELIGNGDMKKGREFLSSRGKRMTEAEFYIGLSFQWKRERITKVDGQQVKLLMPVAYLGESSKGGGE